MANCDLSSLVGCCPFNLSMWQIQAAQLMLECEIKTALETGAITGAPLCGSGDPNGVQTGTRCGQTYRDNDNGMLWSFGGVVGTNTGWD